MLILIVLFVGSLFAQDVETNILTWLAENSKEELKNRLDIIKRTYPNSPVTLFLQAYIEENGDHAIELYKKIVENYPNSQLADDALLRVAQYYYALGSYVIARQYVDNLVDQFADSPLIPEAKYLGARCLIATGYYHSAEEELKEIIKKYPDSPFKLQAKKELVSVDNLSKQEKNSPQIFNLITNPEQQRKREPDSGKYTIQIGAFRDENNATRLQELYVQKGYLAKIGSKYVDGSLLYLVWIGEFETEEQAAKFGEVFKNLHSISFNVVKK